MVISLRSCSTEAIERVQGTARSISETTSSRRPAEIAKNAVLRLQAEQRHAPSQAKEESTISKAFANLQPLRSTMVKLSDLVTQAAKRDFVALQRQLASFLRSGPGVWWHRQGDVITFHDSADQPSTRPEGPQQRYLRSSSLQGVIETREEDWKFIIENSVEIPFPVYIYDDAEQQQQQNAKQQQQQNAEQQQQQQQQNAEQQQQQQDAEHQQQLVEVFDFEEDLTADDNTLRPPDTSLHTKAGKCLARIFSLTPNVRRFDSLQRKAKLVSQAGASRTSDVALEYAREVECWAEKIRNRIVDLKTAIRSAEQEGKRYPGDDSRCTRRAKN